MDGGGVMEEGGYPEFCAIRRNGEPVRARISRFIFQWMRSGVLGGRLHYLDDSLVRNIDDDKSMQICHGGKHRSPVRADRVRPWPAAGRDYGRVFHLLQIDDIDLVRAHRTNKDVAIAPGIQRIVR